MFINIIAITDISSYLNDKYLMVLTLLFSSENMGSQHTNRSFYGQILNLPFNPINKTNKIISSTTKLARGEKA